MLFAVQFANHDDHLLHTVHLEHDVFDLTKFDAEATEFDLVVGAAQDDNITVGEPTGIVARLIDTLTVIVDETFAVDLVEIVVAEGYAAASNIELANHAHG